MAEIEGYEFDDGQAGQEGQGGQVEREEQERQDACSAEIAPSPGNGQDRRAREIR
jgi:hypothetical protein